MWYRKRIINTFGPLGLFGVLINAITDATTKPYEPGSIGNNTLFDKDLNKVRFGEMTQSEFDRNIRSGKYRDNTPTSDYDLWIRRIEKAIEINNYSNQMDRIRLDYVKQQKENGWKLDTSILWMYKRMDDYL